jgi:transposase
MKPEKSEVEPLLNARDVSKILCCSRPLVYKMASRGQLPCIRWDSPGNGKRRPRTVVRFKIEDVLRFMENHYGN